MNSIIEIPATRFECEIVCATHPVLVHFYTTASGAHRPHKSTLEDLARELAGELIIRRVNADENPELVQRYITTKASTLLLFDNGVPIAGLPESISLLELKAKLQGLLADYTPWKGEDRSVNDSDVPSGVAVSEPRHSAPSPDGEEMEVIGLIGGMSWESSAEYYRLINEAVKHELGGLHSAKCILYSVDFAEVERLQRRGEWTMAAQLLLKAAVGVERAGADLLLVCTNTMHKLADAIQAGIGIPLLHIADATAKKVKESGLRRVGLLGTQFTMEQDFYRGRLADGFGLEVIIPKVEDRRTVHRVIYEELCIGTVRPDSRSSVAGIISRMVEGGAEGIILGCTELGLLVGHKDSAVPLFDTTRIHALAAVERALKRRKSAIPRAMKQRYMPIT